jgi:copper chaperone CopZ
MNYPILVIVKREESTYFYSQLFFAKVRNYIKYIIASAIQYGNNNYLCLLIFLIMNAFKTFLALVILITISACKQPQPKVITVATVNTTNDNNIEDKNNLVSYTKSEFNIEGMTCAMGCAKTIENKLANTSGVKAVTVDFEKTLATIEFDPALINETLISETCIKSWRCLHRKKL